MPSAVGREGAPFSPCATSDSGTASIRRCRNASTAIITSVASLIQSARLLSWRPSLLQLEARPFALSSNSLALSASWVLSFGLPVEESAENIS